MKNKEIYVTRSSLPTQAEYMDEISELWESHFLTNMGAKHKKLEKMLKEYLQVENIELFTNGHMALELAIQALEIKGEVITTPFTFASTTHAIVRNGCTPIFCDISSEDYTMDISKIESLITDKTTAIIPVHVYGNVCNMEKIEKIARKNKLKVIYDAAHTFGEYYNGRSVCDYGDVSILSFHATKVFNTIEGGAVCYHDKKIGKKLYQLKNFGIESEDVVSGVGANAKMNEFQAAMGICNLRHIVEEIEKRRKIIEIYRKKLQDIKGIKLPKKQKNIIPNNAYFPILINELEFGYSRDELYEKMKKQKIYCRKYFFPLTNEFECYSKRYNVKETPVAYCVSREVLTLPLYADMTIGEINRVCNSIIELSNKLE